MTRTQHSISKRTLVKICAILVLLYISYRVVTGYFGPVPLRINVSNADINSIVVKLNIKGVITPFSGGHASVTRTVLHEEVKLVNANESTEFPRAYMWMALNPVEYSLEVYHPALNTEYKVVKLVDLGDSNNLPVTVINSSLISELIEAEKTKYNNATPQQKERLKSHIEDVYQKYHLIHIRDHYVPVMKDAQKSLEEIYQQADYMITDCKKLYTIFDSGKDCNLDEVSLRKAIGLE
ncbi:hypothetical protein [Kaarinaea lacus]